MCWDMQKNVAAFEARVAATLAKDAADNKTLRPNGCSWYETDESGNTVRRTACPPHHDVDNCQGKDMCCLYHARLAAEKEMEKYN